MKGISYRSYQELDEYRHIELMWSSSMHVRNVQYWNWLNSEYWGGGKPIIEYAFSNSRLIGSYVIHPLNLSYAGRIFKSGFATQVIIHPEYRDMSILKNLTDNIIKACELSGLDFIYGFPNDSIWNIHIRMFGWKDVGKISTLKLCNAGAMHIDSQKNIFVVTDDDYVEVCEFIWTTSSNNCPNLVSFINSAEWAIWRYYKNPLQYYKLLALRGKDGLEGVIAIKYYNKNSVLIGHIIGLHVLNDSSTVIASLLLEAVKEFKFVGVDVITMWQPNNSLVKKCILDFGFKKNGEVTNFGIRRISKNYNDKMDESINWNLSMFNSDAY